MMMARFFTNNYNNLQLLPQNPAQDFFPNIDFWELVGVPRPLILLPPISRNQELFDNAFIKPADVPAHLICPLSGQIFDDPLKADGLPTVERSWIEQQLEIKRENPFNRQPLFASQLVSDEAMKAEVAKFVEKIRERNMQVVAFQPR